MITDSPNREGRPNRGGCDGMRGLVFGMDCHVGDAPCGVGRRFSQSGFHVEFARQRLLAIRDRALLSEKELIITGVSADSGWPPRFPLVLIAVEGVSP